MARSVIEEIKERLDIVEVIGGYVPLQKAGRNFRALCPFHSEKTPSFYVFPETGTWRCFGACATGGDVISFVEKRENLDFRETLRLLAQRAGVDMDRHRDPQVVSQLNRLREVNALAAAFYHHQLLNTPQGAVARAYLEGRQVNAESVNAFQLGYAVEDWQQLVNYMQDRGVNLKELEAAGLAVLREDGGAYDRFRGRLMIPIRDAQGRTIGFGGRLLGEGEPKYLNTSQTALFDKGSIIFALDLAKRAIRARDQAVLVEGYMDVISAHQRGFANVVAVMGTSVTPHHITRLSRLTQNLVFALDADAAGLNATLRSLHVVRETLANPTPVPTSRGQMRFERRLSASIRIAAMPAGQDPDDVLRQGAERWQALIEAAVPLLDYYFERSRQQADVNSARGKAQIVEELLPIVSEIDDPAERQHYFERLSILSGTPRKDLEMQQAAFARAQVRRGQRRPEPEPPLPDAMEPPPWPEFDEELLESPPEPAAPRPAKESLETHTLAYLLAEPELLASADRDLAELLLAPISLEDFQDAAVRAIFDAQQEFLYSDALIPAENYLAALDPALRPHFTALWQRGQTLQALRPEQRRKDLVDSVLRLRLGRLRSTCRQLETLIRSAAPDEDSLPVLGAELVRATREQKLVERALSSRSHSSRWALDRPRITY